MCEGSNNQLQTFAASISFISASRPLSLSHPLFSLLLSPSLPLSPSPLLLSPTLHPLRYTLLLKNYYDNSASAPPKALYHMKG